MKTLEMSEAEICRRYRENPNFGQIKILAELNDCDVNDIRAILKKGGEKLPMGRPKKSLGIPNFISTDEALKDESEKTCQKEEPKLEKLELPMPKFLIPSSVQEMIREKLESIQRQICMHCDMIDDLNEQKNELEVFLKGEFKKDGDENKLLRKV